MPGPSLGMTGERPVLRSFIALVAALMASPALAHTGSITGGFIGGFVHPVFGPDHVAAMVAVGLWGAFLGRPRSICCRWCFRW